MKTSMFNEDAKRAHTHTHTTDLPEHWKPERDKSFCAAPLELAISSNSPSFFLDSPVHSVHLTMSSYLNAVVHVCSSTNLLLLLCMYIHVNEQI